MATKRAVSEKSASSEKRASSEKKVTRRRKPEPMSATDSAGIDPEQRRQLVAAEAYFRAERRGFTAGHELDDWVAAEAAVDSRVQQQQVA